MNPASFTSAAKLDTQNGMRNRRKTCQRSNCVVPLLDARVLNSSANPMIALRNLLPFGLWRRLGLVPYFVGATYRPAELREALVRVGFDVAEMVMVMHVPRLLVRVLGGLFGQGRERAVVSRLAGLEWIGRAPLGRLTGQYIAADARKPAA